MDLTPLDIWVLKEANLSKSSEELGLGVSTDTLSDSRYRGWYSARYIYLPSGLSKEDPEVTILGKTIAEGRALGILVWEDGEVSVYGGSRLGRSKCVDFVVPFGGKGDENQASFSLGYPRESRSLVEYLPDNFKDDEIDEILGRLSEGSGTALDLEKLAKTGERLSGEAINLIAESYRDVIGNRSNNYQS